MAERRTPLYDIHLRTASKMVKGGGDYLYPLAYTSPVEEHTNTRNNLGMQDLSTMGEVDIKGPGAERLVNRLVVNEIRDMEPGQVRYTSMCQEDGGIVDDVTVYKFSEEHFMIVTSSGPRKKTARWVADHALGSSAYPTDISGAIALLSVQGPRSLEYLQSVAQESDLESLRFFRFTRGVINETELIISRSGYTGELGFELYSPAEEAASLWEYVLQTGKAFGLLPYGVQAMQSLRIEKALPLYGPDIDETRTPFHLGLNRWIRFDKREFVGRDALLRIQDMGLDYRWTGMTLESDVPANNGDKIYSIADIATFREKMFSGSEAGSYFDTEIPGQEEIGEITSSTNGYTVGKMLALGFVRTTHSWPGGRLLVNINDRPVLATVETTPFFDPQGVRLRAKRTRKA
jgi:aminomethyltransferase